MLNEKEINIYTLFNIMSIRMCITCINIIYLTGNLYIDIFLRI